MIHSSREGPGTYNDSRNPRTDIYGCPLEAGAMEAKSNIDRDLPHVIRF